MSGQPNIMSAFGARRSTQAASDSPATHTSSNVGGKSGDAAGGRGQATSSTAAPAEANGYEFTQVPG